jgi:predicted ester cyclase
MMRRTFTRPQTLAAVALILSAVAAGAQNPVENPQYPAPTPERQAPAVERRLETFDTLDFDVFSNQKWDRLAESHAADVIVTWPDGRETKGIRPHIDDLKALFVYAPDIKIAVHPIRFGSGSWTGVTGIMTGTFSKPMPIGDGKFIQPTGKRFALSMATIAQWKDGKIAHEWLFWDNHDFMKQIGLAQ